MKLIPIKPGYTSYAQVQMYRDTSAREVKETDPSHKPYDRKPNPQEFQSQKKSKQIRSVKKHLGTTIDTIV